MNLIYHRMCLTQIKLFRFIEFPFVPDVSIMGQGRLSERSGVSIQDSIIHGEV